MYLHGLHHAKKRIGLLLLVQLVTLPITHQGVEESLSLGVGTKILLTHKPKTVQSPAQGKAFQHFLVHRTEVNALHEIENVLIRAILLPFRHDGLCRRLSHALNGGKPETSSINLVISVIWLKRRVIKAAMNSAG